MASCIWVALYLGSCHCGLSVWQRSLVAYTLPGRYPAYTPPKPQSDCGTLCTVLLSPALQDFLPSVSSNALSSLKILVRHAIESSRSRDPRDSSLKGRSIYYPTTTLGQQRGSSPDMCPKLDVLFLVFQSVSNQACSDMISFSPILKYSSTSTSKLSFDIVKSRQRSFGSWICT
jgi:hypothetical protein